MNLSWTQSAIVALALLAAGCRGCGDDPVQDDDDSTQGCFTAHVPIETPGGPRAIADLVAGDEVVTVDGETWERSVAQVVRVHRFEHPHRIVLRAEGRQLDATTPEHPFLELNSGRWVPASRLRGGDRLLRAEKSGFRAVTVDEVLARRLDEPGPVFNLTVSGPWSTFLADGLLVHNKSQDDDDDYATTDDDDGTGFAPTSLTFSAEFRIVEPAPNDDDSDGEEP